MDKNNSLKRELEKKKITLCLKRLFDIIASLFGLIILVIPFLIISFLIKRDSKGPVFFKQKRLGKDLKEFRIVKFRTMVKDAENLGEKVTIKNDPRITKIGHFLRNKKIDELPQLWNVLVGDMSLVGPRPETREFFEKYSDYDTDVFLVRPGITDYASIKYSDEASLFENEEDMNRKYLNVILPKKIELKLKYIKEISFLGDIKIILQTLHVLKR